MSCWECRSSQGFITKKWYKINVSLLKKYKVIVNNVKYKPYKKPKKRCNSYLKNMDN